MENNNDDDDDDQQKKPASESMQKRKDLFDSLHEEMEIAVFKAETGQRRRNPTRAESAIRTKKRKILEKSDRRQHAVQGDDYSQRLRGSRNAMEDKVIQASQVFADDEDDEDQEADEQGRYEVTDDHGEEGGEDHSEEDDEADEEEEEEEEVETEAASNRKRSAPKRKKRLMYRMRNFKSARMAERHGDALGAHARGQSLAAVRKLEQVAIDAPAAPQVYSSLGLVYESLLSDSRNKRKSTRQDDHGNSDEGSERSIEKQLELAKKAYGSYHVAALLCKKDFSLWVRAGDTAKEIADLFSEAIASLDIEPEMREGYREEKKKWVEEARKDYLAADNQRPPGIDVPAKLAAAHMELGNLSEALVILTDLKNRPAVADELDGGDAIVPRSEFETSYKAWLLYADLMLRIGHECNQWNAGNKVTENYMFRRWLRKWSDNFDWKERRLQALVQALEAAAGSKCSERVVTWSRSRASRSQQEGNETSHDQRRWHVDQYEIGKVPIANGDEEHKEDDDLMRNNGLGGKSSNAAWSLASAREALLLKNKLELEVFDEETETLGLAEGSNASKERASARSALVASHRKSIVDLIGNYHQHHASLENVAASTAYGGEDGDSPKATEPLPISASCAVVCSIASELMKHCLDSELYEGSRLVGEVVSAYLKERAELLERRLEANRSFSERQKSVEESVLLQMEAYDEIGDDESDEGAVDALYLSDDEDILESADEHLIPSLRNGILPPELRFLYALSLIGEGGRVFLARQCIKAIELIEGDNMDALISDPIDTEIVKDPLWYAFRQDLTVPLRKTAAFALLVEVLQRTKQEKEFSDLVTPLVQYHLESLETTGQLDVALFGGETETSKLAVPTRNRVIKLILANARMQLERAKSIADEQEKEAANSAVAVLDRVIPLLQKFWRVELNGSISSFCIESLELLAAAFDFLVLLDGDDSVDPKVFSKLLEVLSRLCGVVIPDPINSEAFDGEDVFNNVVKLPIKSEWQNASHELMSKRIYNLAVGSCVSNFSGWEMEEFNLDLLRGSSQRRFAVNVGGERVSGYLSPSAEAELAHQWQTLNSLLPQLSSFNFKANLEHSKSSSWYKEVLKDINKSGDEMSIYGEKDAFSLFLILSRQCLKAATLAKTNAVKGALMKLSLSVMLPLSEFCLNMQLWESHIGKAAITKTATMIDWNKLARSVGQRESGGGQRTRRARAQPNKNIETAITKRRPVPKTIPVPVSALLSQWREAASANRFINDDDVVKEAMRKVDDATRELRKCFSESAIQKGCIQVALALMDLVAKDYCYNPFLCLQQAAIFASQGSKGGTNDQVFREALPKERECTVQDALVTIGRADCLQSIHFPDEAIYLCCYVARVCRLHRDKLETEMEWNSQWKVIGICLYNLSVAIRTTRSFRESVGSSEYWEDSVIDELNRGRADAIALRESLGIPDHTAPSDVGDSNEEDNLYGNDRERDGSDQGFVEESYHGFDDDVEMVEADSSVAFQPNGVTLHTSIAMVPSDDEEREIVEV